MIGEITTKEGRETTTMNTMIMKTMTTMRKMTEDREVVAQATENQGRMRATEAEEATKTAEEEEIAVEEETITEVETVGEVTNNMIDHMTEINTAKEQNQ